MRILFVSEYFHGEPHTEVGGVFQRLQMLIDAAKELGELDVLFYVHSGIDTSPESVARWEKVLSAHWGTDLTLFLCQKLDAPQQKIRLHKMAGLIIRLLARGAYNISIDNFGVGTSGDAQVRALESCLERRPDVIMAHRLGAIAPLLLMRGPLPPILFDLDDVEHIKYERFVKNQGRRRSGLVCFLKKRLLLLTEYRALHLAQRTFVCSDRDREALHHMWPNPSVVTVPNAVSSRSPSPTPKALTVLFIGYYGYHPNAQAANTLITDIWPRIHEAMPAARLLIAGTSAEKIPAFGQVGPEVEFLGFVEDLDALYERTRVVACPIQVGSGTRVKILEAAAYAKPIVATSIAAEGVDMADGREILLRDETIEFADACLELLADERKCRQLGEQAWASVNLLYNRASVVADISNLVIEAARGAGKSAQHR